MKTLILMFLTAALLLTGCAAALNTDEAKSYRQISMAEAVEMMEKVENLLQEALI